MKTRVIQLMVVIFLGTGSIFAQDMQESQVPSVIVNSFKTEFPKASDVEWERQGDRYSVEFEVGVSTDYEAWFTAAGKLIRYSEEIANSELPEAVKNAISSQYIGYHIDDAKKFTENNVETYSVEIEKGKEELNLIFSKDGKLI